MRHPWHKAGRGFRSARVADAGRDARPDARRRPQERPRCLRGAMGPAGSRAMSPGTSPPSSCPPPPAPRPDSSYRFVSASRPRSSRRRGRVLRASSGGFCECAAVLRRAGRCALAVDHGHKLALASMRPMGRVRDATALDPYVFTREAYRQRRTFLIHDGRPPPHEFGEGADDG